MSRKPTQHTRSRRWIAVTCMLLAATTACGENRKGASEEDQTARASDDTINISASFPFSGPFADLANSSKAIDAYFTCLNEAGGVNGRTIEYTTADDAYDPARLTANARKAVEQDHAEIFMSFGGPNVAIQPYLNENKVPQIVLAGNAEFSQINDFPYTHAWWPELTWEAEVVTTFVMDHADEFPDPKIGLIALNNTLSDSHIAGTVAALGADADAVFPEKNRIKVEPTLADWTSQLNQLRAAGVNVLYMNPGTPAQINAMGYIKQSGWKVKTILYSGSASFKEILEPAGKEASTGVYTPAWLKDPADPRWADDEGLVEYRETLATCGKDVDESNSLTANGFSAAEAVVRVLESMGDEPITGEAFNEAWMSLQAAENGMLMPGSTMSAGDEDGRLVHSYQMQQFDGETWQPVADIFDVRELGIS